MKEIEILKNTAIKGVPVVPGDTVVVDDSDARLLISYGLAKSTEELKKEPQPAEGAPEGEPEPIESVDLEDLSKAELKENLDKRNIEYLKSANKKALIEILAEAIGQE